MDSQMGAHFGTHFGHLALLCCPRQALGAKLTPKTFPRIPGTSLSLNFHRFSVNLNDFVMICRVMWATFCLVCLVSFVGLLNHF